MDYTILIPNSEGKQSGGDDYLTYRFVSNLKKYNEFLTLQKSRELILDELRRVIRDTPQEQLASFFDLKGDNLKQAIVSMNSIRDEECMPTISRMSGVMYKAIDYEGMDLKKRTRFDKNVIIVDGLFGLLKPQDMIPNYKCKVSMRLFDKTLAKYWSEELKGFLKYICKDSVVIDFLPQSHREIIDKEEGLNRIKITFAKKDPSSESGFKQEGHLSKPLKGEFILYLLEFEKITKDDIKKFKHSLGHTFSKEHSKEDEYIFIK